MCECENGVDYFMSAVKKGNIKMVESLLKKIADIEVRSKCVETALMYAAINGNTEMVELSSYLIYNIFEIENQIWVNAYKNKIYPTFIICTFKFKLYFTGEVNIYWMVFTSLIYYERSVYFERTIKSSVKHNYRYTECFRFKS